MPDAIRDQLVRQLNDLSPDELRVVRNLIDTFKGRSGRALNVESGQGGKKEAGDSEEIDRASASEAARRVREALADVSGALSETVVEERRERV